jgi:beta-1,4-mannosyl-glycoprotein beta-1,4-N-acetylglucosaminyltransferase
MIYSCTIFSNEFDLLDLKIAEELNHIDKMIIIEATKTHSNRPKPLRLYKNSKYKHPKIEIRVVGDNFVNDNFWTNIKIQRDAALPNNLKDDDIILLSDVDEIIPAEDVLKIIKTVKEKQIIKIRFTGYRYYINLKVTSGVNSLWTHIFAVTGKYFKEKGNNSLSYFCGKKDLPYFKGNGKHFSLLMSPDKIVEKIKSCPRVARNIPKFTNVDKIKEKIKNKKDLFDRPISFEVVPVDKTYPKTILNNLEFWSKYILKEKV